MKSGEIDNYRWVELTKPADIALPKIVQELARYLTGQRAVNVSWDSGLLLSSDAEAPEGWTFERGHAVSPKIDHSVVSSWPYSGGFDEWYFFSELPTNLELSPYCNWGGSTSIGEWAGFVGAVPYPMDLRRQLRDARPTIVLGEGYNTFLISTNPDIVGQFRRIVGEL
jgi:hypothetical protein